MKKDVGEKPERRTLPRRDLILLPLISGFTALLLLASLEIGGRVAWPETEKDACIAKIGMLGFRAKPNCTVRIKAAEGPWVENHYNDCGLRQPNSCHTPRDGRLRLVAVGASISFGYLIPYEQTWQARTVDSLSRMCGRTVEYQNYSGLTNLNESALRAPEAAATHPDAAVMVVFPTDMYDTPTDDFDVTMGLEKAAAAKAPPEAADAVGFLGGLDFRALKSASRAAVIAEHFMFKNGPTYLQLYLRNGDKADFLRQPFSPTWKKRLDVLDRDVGFIAEQMRAQNVPLLVVFTPQQAQAELISGMPGQGTDPFALGKAIGEIARKHGATFVDNGNRFRSIENVPDYYYPVDGHLNAKGDAVLAEAVEDGLIGGPSPLLSGCKLSRPVGPL